MIVSKITIRKKIFATYIGVIAIFVLLTFVAFNFCLNYYMKKHTRNQLIETAEVIESTMKEYSTGMNINGKLENIDDKTKLLLKINRDLEENQSFKSFDYAIIDANNKLIYPEREDIKEYTLVESNLIPKIKQKKLFELKANRKKAFFTIERKYEGAVYALNFLSSDKRDGYLIVYTDLLKSNNFIKIINTILMVILVITAVIFMLIANNLAKKISNPISQLSTYVKQIGDRKYDAEFIRYKNNDEIGELAKTMHSMVEKLSVYDNTMKTFIQNASHELRTPLMSIQGYAEGIKYGVVEEQGKAVDIIIEESKRLSQLVEDLLYLSKIESMQEKFNLEEMAVEDIIKSSIERVNGIALKNNKTIKFSSNYNNIIILGDEEKLTRAIINILGNCLRYCRESIEVILKKEDSKIILTIKDDGPGFEENEILNVFDRFYKGKNGNYGLGLAITKSIVEKHGGNVFAENSTKGGALFKIILRSNEP